MLLRDGALSAWQRVYPLDGEPNPRTYFCGLALALWLARPSHASTILVAHAGHDDSKDENDGWLVHCWQPMESLRPHPSYHSVQLDAADLGRASALFSTREAGSRNAVEGAFSLLWMALSDRWWPGRFIVLWTALEALFAPPSPGETTYRISQRIALFLSDNSAECVELARHVRRLYAMRSRVVHGHAVESVRRETLDDVTIQTETLLRRALTRILDRKDVLAIFSGGERERFLEELPLHRNWS